MTSQQRLVLTIAIMASFVGALDGFIVNVALPAISRDLGGGLVVQQWVVDAYLLTLGSFILIAGSISDLFGRRRVLSAGLLWFGITSLLCVLAPNGTTLVVARALQGIAGALLVPSSLALIISAFTGPAQGKAIGVWTAWFSVAAVVGPIAGGLLLAAGSWRWIFGVNVPVIVLTLWLMQRLEQGDRTKDKVRVDIVGALMCTLGLAGSVYALIEQPKYGWSDPMILWPFTPGIGLLAGFIWYESRARSPMLPLSLFKVRNFSVGNLATCVIYAGLGLAPFMLIITLQQIAGYSPLRSGLAFLPVTFLMVFLSSRFGTLAGKYGPRIFMTLGPLTMALGYLLMLRMNTHVNYFTELLPGVLVFGVGLACMVAPLTSAVLGDIDAKHAGVASAVNNAVSRIAGLIAVAFAGVITGPHLTINGFHRTLIVTAILFSLGGLISAIGIQNPKTDIEQT